MLFSAAVCSSSFPGTHFQNVNPPDIFLILFFPPEIIIMILSLHYMSCGPLCCTGRSHTGSLNSAVWLLYKHVKVEKKKKTQKNLPSPQQRRFQRNEKWYWAGYISLHFCESRQFTLSVQQNLKYWKLHPAFQTINRIIPPGSELPLSVPARPTL